MAMEQVTEWAASAGETISVLTLHQLDRACVERAKRFIQQHGGRWSALPPETGAKYFIEFPSGTRIFLGQGRQQPDELRYDIILPDFASSTGVQQARTRSAMPPEYNRAAALLARACHPPTIFAAPDRTDDGASPCHEHSAALSTRVPHPPRGTRIPYA